MFGRLTEYQSAEYCREHPVMYLYVPGHRFRLEIVAAYDVSANDDCYTLPVDWEEWQKIVEKGKKKTAWDFDIPISETDHFVTLSTCAYIYDDARWIIIARINDPEGILQSSAELPQE